MFRETYRTGKCLMGKSRRGNGDWEVTRYRQFLLVGKVKFYMGKIFIFYSSLYL